jgi:hypothetical protein
MTVSYQAMRGLANVPWFWATSQYEVANSTSGLVLTASATSHAKGAWTQVFSSTASESALLFFAVSAVATAATETSMLVDLAVGASGSEQAILSGLAVGGASAASAVALGIGAPLPVRIPAGSRISARIQSLIPSDTATLACAVVSLPGRALLPTSVDVLGTSAATSRGTALSGASGSWTKITDSTPQRYRGVFVVPSVIGTDLVNQFSATLSIGVGAAGSEVTLGTQRMQYRDAESAFIEANVPQFPIACDIPAGSRIAVKHNIAANSDRYGVCLVGIP